MKQRIGTALLLSFIYQIYHFLWQFVRQLVKRVYTTSDPVWVTLSSPVKAKDLFASFSQAKVSFPQWHCVGAKVNYHFENFTV